MWQPVTFHAPASMAAIRSQVGPVSDQAPGELSTSAGRLTAVSGQVTMTTNPVAAAAAGCAALRAQLEALMVAGGRFVCIHPYLHPVGDRRGDYAYLTPMDAVAALAAKLADAADPPPDGTLGALVLMIRETTHTNFQGALSVFNTVFPVTGFQLAQRRAGYLATLEADKLVQPVGPAVPPWRGHDPRRQRSAMALDRTLGGLVALAEGYDAENTRPEAELAAVMDEKAQRVADMTAAWDTLSGQFQGAAGLGLYLEGDGGSIRRQLLASEPPAPTYKLTALACWLATPGDLTLFREIFGL